MEAQRFALTCALEGLVSVLVGTADDARRPECLIAFGLVVEPDGRHASVFLPDATNERTLANLRSNGKIAVSMDRPTTHRAVQMKGRMTAVRKADEGDRAALERCASAFFAEVEEIGVPPAAIRRANAWPCHVVTFQVDELFVQTPGPGAGDPYAGASA